MNYQLFLTLLFLVLTCASAMFAACVLSAWVDCSRSTAARIISGILG